jgi:NAD(P)H-hydrate epimerase
MRPVGTIAEVRAADARALLSVDEATLVTRAGTAVARACLRELGGAYGRRVIVVAGKGNNGADGRVAAQVLELRGSLVRVVEADTLEGPLGPCDLVVDAAFGTGFRGRYDAPAVRPGTPVVAVDIPSGLDGDRGLASGVPMVAATTVTFACLKPGLLQGDGPGLAGRLDVADIGVPVEAGIALLDDGDGVMLPARARTAHKWSSAVAVVAGSPGMEGAAVLCARGASHAGAGMVRLCVPGSAEPGALGTGVRWPLEAVRLAIGSHGWAGPVLEILDRVGSLVIGPGLGRDPETLSEIRRLVDQAPVPVVADADALVALADARDLPALVRGSRTAAPAGRPVVLTPHDGEYRALAGEDPGPVRTEASRALAGRTGGVVLLKGALTAVAAPAAWFGTWTETPGAGLGLSGGRLGGDLPVLLCGAGTPALATAGTGDVLAGIIGAFLARGLPSPFAAALAAHVHGRAARAGHREGLVAADLPELVAGWLGARLPAEDPGA